METLTVCSISWLQRSISQRKSISQDEWQFQVLCLILAQGWATFFSPEGLVPLWASFQGLHPSGGWRNPRQKWGGTTCVTFVHRKSEPPALVTCIFLSRQTKRHKRGSRTHSNQKMHWGMYPEDRRCGLESVTRAWQRDLEALKFPQPCSNVVKKENLGCFVDEEVELRRWAWAWFAFSWAAKGTENMLSLHSNGVF